MAINIDTEKLKYLLAGFEYEFDNWIYGVLNNSDDTPRYSAAEIAYIMECYISVMKYMDGKPPYVSVKKYFDDNAFTRKEYRRFERLKQLSKSDVIRRESTNIDKIKFLLETVKEEIVILIKNVVNDSETDPHYSAVTASNKIKCYIDVMNELCEKLPFEDVVGFLEFNGFTKEEQTLFDRHRKTESEYYIGKRY